MHNFKIFSSVANEKLSAKFYDLKKPSKPKNVIMAKLHHFHVITSQNLGHIFHAYYVTDT